MDQHTTYGSMRFQPHGKNLKHEHGGARLFKEKKDYDTLDDKVDDDKKEFTKLDHNNFISPPDSGSPSNY